VSIPEDDSMRNAERPRSVWRARAYAAALIAVVALGALTDAGHRGLRWIAHVDDTSLGAVSAPPRFTIPRDDPWRSFLAPESVCPGSNEPGLAAAIQQRTAMCLVNYARGREGVAPLRESPEISAWSALKAADIVRCREFAHTACGRSGDAHARAAGFNGAFGENLFLGPQEYKTPLAAVDGWLNSPDHRENLFRGGWTAQGIAVLHTDHLRGQDDVAVWVSQFTA
jgi:uncharacterized protein YkwD